MPSRKNTFQKTRGKKVTGTWPNRNLRFLTSYMDQTGQTVEKIAAKIGISRQGMLNMLHNDNMKLSRAQQIFDADGCTLTFHILVPPSTENTYVERYEHSTTINLAIDNDLLPASTNTDTTRLGFVREAMRKAGCGTQKDLCRRLAAAGEPASEATVGRWLSDDDLMVSHIYRIAKALDAELEIRIRQKTDEAAD